MCFAGSDRCLKNTFGNASRAHAFDILKRARALDKIIEVLVFQFEELALQRVRSNTVNKLLSETLFVNRGIVKAVDRQF